jgi:glucose-6-phosphate 1-dehydrogenase
MSSGNVVKISPIDDKLTSEDTAWLTSSSLSIVVVGASGDLAKKKTYPSLLNLYDDNLLPKDTLIWGYARSSLTDDDLRDRLRPYLLSKKMHSQEVVEAFLQICRYQEGTGYGDEEAFGKLNASMESHEAGHLENLNFNRLFYFAIPPNVFAETGIAIKKTCMQDEKKGFSRIIIEKPFGRE